MDRRSFFRSAAVAPIAIASGGLSTIGGGLLVSRVSTEAGDPGEKTFCAMREMGYRPLVRLNGVKQKYCVTADSEKGFVKRLVRGPDGNPMVNAAGDELLIDTIYGRVEIAAVRVNA